MIYPPVPIPDIWSDRRLDFTETLEERLIAAACLHTETRHIALLAAGPPGLGWKRLAKRFKKQLVHVPLSKFSDQTVQQLRQVHVLNGKEIRSYAADFIRKP
jgi:DNA polymerase III delta prime subunit